MHTRERGKGASALLVIGFRPSAHLPVVQQSPSIHEPCFTRPLGGVSFPFSLIASDQFSQEDFPGSCEQSSEIPNCWKGSCLKIHLAFFILTSRAQK